MITLKTKDKDFAKIHFVAKARRRITRDKPWLLLIHVSDQVAVASDGHRVHWAPGVTLPTGSYLVTLCTERKIILAPTETYPYEPFTKAMACPPEDMFLELGCNSVISLRRMWREIPNGPTVNPRYFMDLHPCNKIALWSGGESYYAANDSIGISARLMGIC